MLDKTENKSFFIQYYKIIWAVLRIDHNVICQKDIVPASCYYTSQATSLTFSLGAKYKITFSEEKHQFPDKNQNVMWSNTAREKFLPQQEQDHNYLPDF